MNLFYLPNHCLVFSRKKWICQHESKNTVECVLCRRCSRQWASWTPNRACPSCPKCLRSSLAVPAARYGQARRSVRSTNLWRSVREDVSEAGCTFWCRRVSILLRRRYLVCPSMLNPPITLVRVAHDLWSYALWKLCCALLTQCMHNLQIPDVTLKPDPNPLSWNPNSNHSQIAQC